MGAALAGDCRQCRLFDESVILLIVSHPPDVFYETFVSNKKHGRARQRNGSRHEIH